MSDTTEEREPQAVSFPTMLRLRAPNGRILSQQFDDPESYEAARAAGWRSSPASFGIETHPSQPGAVMGQESLQPPASPTSVDLSEVTALLMSAQVQLEQMNQGLVALTQCVATLEGAAHTGMGRPPEVARTTSDAPPPETTEPKDDEQPHIRGRK